MFRENLFGPGARPATTNHDFKVGGIQVEIYFSPEDDVAAHLLSLIQEAQESIHFMAYSFTSNSLGNAILQRLADGLTVAGVMDDSQVKSNQGTEYDPFKQAGMDVRRDGNAGQMHHKVIIIDQSIVITGSYNFSSNAQEQNDENVVIIRDAKIAAEYMAEFKLVYNQAQKP